MFKRMKNFIEDQASVGYSSEEENEDIKQQCEINRKQAEKMFREQMIKREKRQNELSQRLQKIIDTQNQIEYHLKDSDQQESESDHELPQLTDPKIYRCYCKNGNELQFLLELCLNLKQSDHITSIFCTPKVKGSIFFEAHFERDVNKILPIYPRYHLEQINPEECLDFFENNYKINLDLGQWVRIKKHKKYLRDLGRVVQINRASKRVTLKVIQRDNQNNKIPITCRTIIEQQPIEEGYTQNTKSSNYIYDDIDVERKVAKLDGFELLNIKASHLESNIQITEEELQMFFPDLKDRKTLVQQAKKELMRRVDVELKVGQKVRLLSETDESPEFTINKIFDDNMLELGLKHKNQDFTYLVHASEVKLAFKKYQSVRVIDGPHKGDVGIIISIKSSYVVIATDQTSYRVPHSVLEQGNENFTTNYNLVSYGQSELEIGCIVKQKIESVLILNLSNEIVEKHIGQIKIMNQNQIQINQYNEQLKINDNVVVVEGRFRNNYCLIKQNYMGKVYLFNQIFPNSIIVENINNVRLLIGHQQQIKSREAIQLIGKSGIVITGEWKGYRCLVVGTSSINLIVQIECKNKKVKIKISDFKEHEDKDNKKQNVYTQQLQEQEQYEFYNNYNHEYI